MGYYNDNDTEPATVLQNMPSKRDLDLPTPFPTAVVSPWPWGLLSGEHMCK